MRQRCYTSHRYGALVTRGMLPADVPYVLLRVIRRNLPTQILRLLTGTPLMPRCVGEVSGERLANWYRKYFRLCAPPITVVGKKILEVGTGATNAVCYEFAAEGALWCQSYEPFVRLDQKIDEPILADCARRHNLQSDFIRKRTSRISSIEGTESDSFDLIISNSVLEHVTDLTTLSEELFRVLKRAGRMVHIIDCRDHFYPYPYHHLIWSRSVWNRWLDPGDQPRWRITDPIRAFEKLGLKVDIVEANSLPDAFAKVRDRIHPDFAGYPADQMQVAWGVIQAVKSG